MLAGDGPRARRRAPAPDPRVAGAGRQPRPARLTASVAADDVAAVLAGVPGAAPGCGGQHDDRDAARGAAYLAGLGTGVWSAPSALPGRRRPG